jgi:hypothetical protein
MGFASRKSVTATAVTPVTTTQARTFNVFTHALAADMSHIIGFIPMHSVRTDNMTPTAARKHSTLGGAAVRTTVIDGVVYLGDGYHVDTPTQLASI